MCFVVENIKNGIVKQFYFEDIPSLRERDDVILLDTRTPFEYMRGHAEDFINIPLDDLRERLGELDKTKKILDIVLQFQNNPNSNELVSYTENSSDNESDNLVKVYNNVLMIQESLITYLKDKGY